MSNSARQGWLRALAMTAEIGRDASLTLPKTIEAAAAKSGRAPALLSDRASLTYGALAERSNRYARWALAQGLGKGDVVSLLMSNCSEYAAVWLGLTRIGVVVALVNSHLAGEALAHSLRVAAPRLVLVDGEHAEVLAMMLPLLAPGIDCRSIGDDAEGKFPRLEDTIAHLSGDPLDERTFRPPMLRDRALCIYTSGTTGLPKAANVSHFRLLQWSRWFAGMMDVKPEDRMYNCLPMYHSIGGVVAIGAMLVGGASVVVRPRFSASHFWDEVVAWDCTLFQYIGELCRYLVNSPPHPRESQHRIRLCCGNGLGAAVWTAFERRFRVPQIVEFYAATEGTFSLYNCDGKPGAIGRIPRFLAHRIPIELVAFDVDAGAARRNEDGFCTRCAPGEVGEAIGRIVDDGTHPATRFEGYTDEAASQQKVLRSVFAEGDAWYRTGDLMRRDAEGYFYFVDRIGDTFRWKGENVSTAEVAAAIAACPGVLEAVAYGVAVPGAEGRACMAAITVAPGFDLARLRRQIAGHLPEYARPLFLRITSAIETTETLKPRKQGLVRDGYDPASSTDPLYFDDRPRSAFVALDRALHRRLQKGIIRF